MFMLCNKCNRMYVWCGVGWRTGVTMKIIKPETNAKLISGSQYTNCFFTPTQVCESGILYISAYSFSLSSLCEEKRKT